MESEGFLDKVNTLLWSAFVSVVAEKEDLTGHMVAGIYNPDVAKPKKVIFVAHLYTYSYDLSAYIYIVM